MRKRDFWLIFCNYTNCDVKIYIIMYLERRIMDGFYNFCKRNQIFMVMFLMIGSSVQISIATSDSCPVSPSTVEIVGDCPVSEEKWREAAARKNCEGRAIASQCDDPDKLVYHCVINAFVNQTLEVCAYSRIITSGYCTEYNFGGNRIQQNFRGHCSKFTQNPCPSLYPSTDAYKYPGCYEMTKKTTVEPATMTTLSTKNATHMNNENQTNEGLSTGMVVVVLVLVVLVLIFAVFISYIMRRKRIYSRFRKKDKYMIYEEEPLPLSAPDTATVDSEAENLNVVPSGQCIWNGDKTRNIQIVEEEDVPERFLKPEENPEKDCQTLLSLLSDGFERLAVISSENSNADNQPNLQNLHHEYYNPKLRISEESTQILETDLAQVESLIEYFKISKKKQGVCKE